MAHGLASTVIPAQAGIHYGPSAGAATAASRARRGPLGGSRAFVVEKCPPDLFPRALGRATPHTYPRPLDLAYPRLTLARDGGVIRRR